MAFNILIGADIVPTKTNEKLFAEARVEELVGKELLYELERASFTIMNLEVPLSDKTDEIDKAGPNLIASKETICGIKKINPHLLTLANNHIMDQGLYGLKSTIHLLEKNDIQYIGAGFDAKEAKKPYVFIKDGKRIGVYACAEHEFSIVENEMGGANPYDPLYSYDDVVELKEKTDFVIVLYHGMKEEYRYPSPQIRKRFRRFVDKGADLVIAQHTHCIGCEEDYGNGKLIYGQGNFLFDEKDNEYWNNSLLLSVEFNDNNVAYKYLPIVRRGNVVRKATEDEKAKILFDFISRSKEIKIDGVVEKKYDEYSIKMIGNQLKPFLGKYSRRFFFRIVNYFLYKGRLPVRKFNKKQLLLLENYIECEAHSELIVNGIKCLLRGENE